MPRPHRIDYLGARHHAMNRGARKAAIFVDDACCGKFVSYLAEFPERFGVSVHGYTLMPNHFHLMLESRSGRLSTAMAYLQSRYSRWLNQRYEWDGPLFRGRFRNRVVEVEDYWRHLLAYIHLNPVRANLRKNPDKAEWTSHTAYVGLENRPRWLECDELVALYGSVELYQEYLRNLQFGRSVGPEDYDPDGIWKGPLSGLIRATRSPDQGLKTSIPVWSDELLDDRLGRIFRELESVTGLSREKLLRPSVGRNGNRARWLTAWWMRWAGQLSGSQAAAVLGVKGSGVSQMVSKARLYREQDELLDGWMTALEQQYQPR